ncbi:MAG TPA: DinB family protein [Terriglobales bacterium]|nr:DinB family protein [Terriglobales bacterium]
MPLPAGCANRLKTQLDCLSALLAGTADGSLERRPIADKWSARENLAHLARYHEVSRERLQRILSEDRPALGRYRAEDDPEWPKWQALPTAEIMSRLASLRAKLLTEVDRLSDDEVKRTGRHPRFGEMTVAQWLEFFLLHEAHHLFVVMQRVRE